MPGKTQKKLSDPQSVTQSFRPVDSNIRRYRSLPHKVEFANSEPASKKINLAGTPHNLECLAPLPSVRPQEMKA